MQNMNYFQELETKKVSNKTNANNNITQINEKIQSQIQQGKTLIQQQDAERKSRIKQLSNKIQSKKDQLKKQLGLLNLSLKRKSYSVRAYNRKKSQKAISLRSYRSGSEISEEDFQQYQKKKIQASNRLKQLKKLRDIANQRRKQIDKKRLQKLQSENLRREKEESEEKQKQKQEKLKAIRQKIQKFQQNKQIRLSRLKQSLIKSNPHLPKYKQMKSDFENQQQRLKSERRISYKKDIHSKFQEYEFEKINQHQKQYIEKLKQKFVRIKRAKTQDSPKEKLQKQLGFKLIGKDQQSLKEGQRKLLKMKEFEQIQNKIKINVNIHKNMEILIAKDKAENPMKYIFLRQKNLNDYQIYKDFKNFNMEVDGKQLGNSYLNQVIKKNRKLASTSRNSSEVALKTQASSSQRKQYKNYLQHGKRNARKKETDQVQKLFQQYGDKSKVMQVLQQRSELQRAQALDKIGKMRKLKTYGQTVEVQRQIDSDYINSIKTKLKCIGIK